MDGPTRNRDQDHLKHFLGDASGLAGGAADFVVHPSSVEEVQEVMREISAEGIPLTVSGGNTGLAGGAIPWSGGVMATDRLTRIDPIDTTTLAVNAGAGILLRDLQDHAASAGYLYPPDPTERLSRVGGTISTNASGARTFRYGPTREWIRGLVVVLADGRRVTLRRGEQVAENGILHLRTDVGSSVELRIPEYSPPKTSKNATGYLLAPDLDAVDLFIGSEGTLGIVTEAEFQLVPLPDALFSGLLFFESEQRMLDFVRTARSRSRTHESNSSDPLCARAIEYIDQDSLLSISSRYPELPAQEAIGGAIWFEQEGEDISILEAWDELVQEHTALYDLSFFGLDEVHHRRLREIRHAVPSRAHHILMERGVRKFGTDMAVPEISFETMFRFYRFELAQSGMESMIWGHIGNGHLHVNLLPKSPSEEAAAKELYDRFVTKALSLGGTVSAEHGIGKLKRSYLLQQIPEEVIVGMREIKRSLDPSGILGRGTLFFMESEVT